VSVTAEATIHGHAKQPHHEAALTIVGLPWAMSRAANVNRFVVNSLNPRLLKLKLLKEMRQLQLASQPGRVIGGKATAFHQHAHRFAAIRGNSTIRSASSPSTRLSIGRRTSQEMSPSKSRVAAISMVTTFRTRFGTLSITTPVLIGSLPCGWRNHD
jgi:hypothetical protein